MKFDLMPVETLEITKLFLQIFFQAEANSERYTPIRERFVGQIWDSAMDIEGIPDGLSKAITNNNVIQKSLERYLR